MTNLVDSIINEAEVQIANGLIGSGGNLTLFLQRASYRDGLVSERSLVDAAIRKGLYRELGRKYQQRLDTILEAARSEIAGGKIRTPDELRAHLQEEARRIPGTNDSQRTEMHLLIDARQKGLYHLLGQNQLPKALSLELSADSLAA